MSDEIQVKLVSQHEGLENKNHKLLLTKMLNFASFSKSTRIEKHTCKGAVHRKAIKLGWNEDEGFYVSDDELGYLYGICYQVDYSNNTASIIPFTQVFIGYLFTEDDTIKYGIKLDFDNNGFVIKARDYYKYNMRALSETFIFKVNSYAYNIEKYLKLVKVVFYGIAYHDVVIKPMEPEQPKPAPVVPPKPVPAVPPKAKETLAQRNFKRLNEDEKTALDLFVEYLGEDKKEVLLKLNINKVKSFLTHVNDELTSCGGAFSDNDQNRKTLGNNLKKHFTTNPINVKSLDSFKKLPSITCAVQYFDIEELVEKLEREGSKPAKLVADPIDTDDDTEDTEEEDVDEDDEI